MSDKVKILKRGDRIRVVTPVGERSMTKQSHKDECDVNKIMAQYAKTGQIHHVRHVVGSYGDFVGAPAYHDALNVLIEAQEAFEMLPAQLRKRFDNDPAMMLEFLDDPENEAEAVELGLKAAERPIEEPGGSVPPEPEKEAKEPSKTAESGSDHTST